MRKYSWWYGLIHWFVHYSLAVLLVMASGIVIIPVYFPVTLFGMQLNLNVFDYLIIILITSLIDLDHMPVLERFGVRKYLMAQKRLVSPIHNFFFLSVFSIASAFSAIFVSKVLGVLIFSIVLHLLWDIIEDVVIWRTTFRRWENTWGLKKKDIEEAYEHLVKERNIRLKIKKKLKD